MKKGIKLLLWSFVLAILCIIAWIVNDFIGNPVSKLLANRAAKQYIEMNYPNRQMTLTNANYNFKFDHYWIQVQEENSVDTHFELYFDSFGHYEGDSYESDVTSGWNTYCRLDNTYNAMVKTLEQNPPAYQGDIVYGILMTEREELGANENDVLEISTLVLDKEYDSTELAKQYGKVVFYAKAEEATVEKAAEYLLNVKNRLDQEGVPFYCIDFTLQQINEGEEKPNHEAQIWVTSFPYSKIYEDGLVERVEEAYQEEQKKDQLSK